MSKTTDALTALAFAVAIAAFMAMVFSANAHAGPAWKDYGTSWDFEGPIAKAVRFNTAVAIRAIEEDWDDPGVNRPLTQQTGEFYAGAGPTSIAIGNQSNIECEGTAYCNVGQTNDDSNQQAQTNLNEGDQKVAQVGDDVDTDLYVTEGYPE